LLPVADLAAKGLQIPNGFAARNDKDIPGCWNDGLPFSM